MTARQTIRPLPRISRVDAVVTRIHEFIAKNRLQAGDRLPGELEWARRLDVSRPVVREAVGRLQSLGVLTVARGRGRGMLVGGQDAVLHGARAVRAAMSVSPKDMRQFAEFRAALEIFAVRRAALLATPRQIDQLERLCRSLDTPHATHRQAVRADFRFHRKIAEIAGNAVILHTLEVSQQIVEQGIYETRRRNLDRNLDSTRLHRRIVSAIRRRDPDAAQRAMSDHLGEAVRFYQSAGSRPSRPKSAATTRRSSPAASTKRRSTAALLRSVVFVAACTLTAAACADDLGLPPTLEQQLLAESPAALAAEARTSGSPQRGAAAFFQPHLACSKCHSSGDEHNPLGPDLSRLEGPVTAEHLVEAVLLPSKSIRKGYEATVLELADGTATTVLVVSEDDKYLLVRDIGQGGIQRNIPRRNIETRAASNLSIMPAGQVNLIGGRQQFLDLTAYLIAIAEGGPARARELKPPEPPKAPDTAGERPRVFRTLMPESAPASLAVALSSDVWVCFDPQRGGVNYAWVGTLDLAPTVEQKINQPALVQGRLFYRDSVTGPLRPLSRASVPRVRMEGYRFVDDGVVISYRVGEVSVRERLTPLPDGLGVVRRLELAGPPQSVWLLADAQTASSLEVQPGRRDGDAWRIDLADGSAVLTITIRATEPQP